MNLDTALALLGFLVAFLGAFTKRRMWWHGVGVVLIIAAIII